MTKHRHSSMLVPALAAMAALGPQTALAAPETFNTALPVGTGDFVFRGQFLAIEANDDPTSEIWKFGAGSRSSVTA